MQKIHIPVYCIRNNFTQIMAVCSLECFAIDDFTFIGMFLQCDVRLH